MATGNSNFEIEMTAADQRRAAADVVIHFLECPEDRYANVISEIQKFREIWDESDEKRFEELCASLGNLKVTRYVVKEDTIYGDKNPIDDCFDPLIADRAKIETSTKDLKWDCRVKGFLMLATQAAALGTCYAAFIKANAKHPSRLDFALGAFIRSLGLIGGVISVQLHQKIKDGITGLAKQRRDLIEKADERVSPFAIKLENNIQMSDTQIEDKIKLICTLSTAENLKKEGRVISLLKIIKSPIDVGWLKWTVFLEMILLSFGISAGLAAIARYFILTTNDLAPK